jgi:predicted secreted protein
MRSEKATAGGIYLRCKGDEQRTLKYHQTFRKEELKGPGIFKEDSKKLLKKARAHTGLSSQ